MDLMLVLVDYISLKNLWMEYETRILLEDIIMRAEDTLQFMMDFRGDMYYSRQECLNQLFCVIGNGYEWIDGELVEGSIETSELLSRWQLSNPIEHAKPTKSWEEYGKINEEIWNRRGIKTDRWYPLSKKYSYLFNYPKDIKPDWMALVEECRQMLIDNGIDLENVPD